ncbi:hypothetical protein A2988_02585 [Candidatus Azambacteria bacterium RIFCSPLOWO2_01_FULL_46_25]|uniref:Uncharacterized protein n=1 Tax=Candidatus Azambacteria bacterium RIFCSPLOWO2_01_FULL_46_25 TaxID=1797298 RepID=A0A1F5BUV2_9BACT|nr:MAG: hypothetical protein A2988_02585 [Candidatus Azambacteria bacterium RIFCSPLOWO2_01_FULL_46_25]
MGSGTLTTSKNDELVVAGLTVNADASNFSAWTNSFTERNDFSSKTGVSNTRSTFGAADRIVGAAGAYTTTATSALSGAWIGQIASFRIASLLTQSTYQWFANADSTGVGSALAAQDSVVTVFAAGNTFRLRLLLHVADAQVLTSGVSLKLQFAAKGTGTCAAPAGGSPAVYTDISAAAGEVRYYNNPTPADGAALTANAGDPTHLGHTVVPESYEEANAFTNAQGAILSGQDGLWDFALVNDSALNSSNYCFRAVYATGAILSSYGVYPELTIGNQPPSLSGTALNGGAAISLVEGTTKSVSVAATATDPNGFSDFASATSTIYRSGVGAACAANNSNCYAVASCSFSSCAGNSCTVTCTASMQFFADPTDIGTFAAETWMGTITVVDKQGASASSTAPAVELNTLYAISTPAAINYGSLNPSTDTGATNQTMVITNTGNAAITIPVSGADMTGPGTIPVSQQKYSLSSFTYSAGGTALTAVSTASGLNLAKPTSTTPVQGTLYWGVGVPNGTPSGSYGGTNTIIAAP